MKKILIIIVMIQWNILYSADGAAQKVSPKVQALIEQKKEAALSGRSLLQRSDRVGGLDGVSNIVKDIINDGRDPEEVFSEARAFIERQKSMNHTVSHSSVEHDSKSELEVVGRRWK